MKPVKSDKISVKLSVKVEVMTMMIEFQVNVFLFRLRIYKSCRAKSYFSYF